MVHYFCSYQEKRRSRFPFFIFFLNCRFFVIYFVLICIRASFGEYKRPAKMAVSITSSTWSSAPNKPLLPSPFTTDGPSHQLQHCSKSVFFSNNQLFKQRKQRCKRILPLRGSNPGENTMESGSYPLHHNCLSPVLFGRKSVPVFQLVWKRCKSLEVRYLGPNKFWGSF